MLEAVLFDLDDTLVLADNDALMRDYVSRLAQRFTHVPADKFHKQLIGSTLHVIAETDGQCSFMDRFCRHFFAKLGIEQNMTPFIEFYRDEYAELGRYAHPAPGARAAVEYAQSLGLKIAVATNPVFPWAAIEKRLVWAGLNNVAWDFITTGDDMRYCKPYPQYFSETAERLGVDPQKCLMIGNDPDNDLPAATVGMYTYLVIGQQANDNEALQAFTNTVQPTANGIRPDFQGALVGVPAALDQLIAGAEVKVE